MPFLIDFTLLLILFSLFNQNNAGVFRQIQRANSETIAQYYSRMRNNNVYRGVVLTKSLEEQTELCREVFNSLMFQDAGIQYADDKESDSIIVREMIFGEQVIAEKEAFIGCRGVSETLEETELPKRDFFYMSFAFETNVFHVSQNIESQDSQVEIFPDLKVLMSPEIALDDLWAIIDLYESTRQNIEVLRGESDKYVAMIEGRDDIQALSDEDKLSVCASILSSSHYQSKNYEIDIGWAEKSKIIESGYRPIRFLNKDKQRNDLPSHNITCKARNSVSRKSYNFYYTGSYSNEDSVFFLTIEDSDLEFDTYVKNIPALMNAQRKSGIVRAAVPS